MPLRIRNSVRREMPTHADPPIAMLFAQMQNACIKEQFVALLERRLYWGPKMEIKSPTTCRDPVIGNHVGVYLCSQPEI